MKSDSNHQKIRSRHAPPSLSSDEPEFTTEVVHYDFSRRTRAITHGGIGVIHNLVNSLGLRQMIDEWLTLLKKYRPYHESDHVLNIAYNILCGGRTLDDIERLRNDANYIDALGARAIPDPTTAGDFCRRFSEDDIWTLMHIINDVRVDVWRRRGPELLEQTAGHLTKARPKSSTKPSLCVERPASPTFSCAVTRPSR